MLAMFLMNEIALRKCAGLVAERSATLPESGQCGREKPAYKME
jgi:hypothetical protein